MKTSLAILNQPYIYGLKDLEMKTKLVNLLLLFGVSCFLIGAAALFLGRLEAPVNYALPAMGLNLIGAGTAGKRQSRKERG